MTKKSTLSLIFKEFLDNYPWYFFWLFVFLVLEGVAAILSILTVVPLADFVLDPSLSKASRITEFVLGVIAPLNWTSFFWIFGGLFVATNLLKGLLEVMIRYAILRIKYAVIRGLVGDTLRTFFQSRWGFFSGAESGRLLNTMSHELNIVGDTLGALANLLARVVQLGIYLAVPFWLNAQLTLTALGLAVVFGAPFLLIYRLSYRLGRRNTETANVTSSILSEVLIGARIILGFGRQADAVSRYLEAFDKHTAVTLRSQVLVTAIPKMFQPMGILAIVIAVGFALQKDVPISELAAVMWSLLGAMPILSSLLQGNASINNFLPSYEQLMLLRGRASELKEIRGSRIFDSLDQGIQLENITFTYPERNYTLRSVSLNIKKGEMTALVGESGSGKSTIADLVLGLQVPDKGRLLMDGVELGVWDQNSFRQRIGYVPQDPFLFHSSIRHNLLWANPRANDSELWDALRLSNAADFVTDLPQGLDTVVGDRGTRLSGGQCQRIALARALLRKPELLILDEATSALDSESEKLIQEAIETVANKTTILIIAHRLSTIVRADQVYVLDRGHIVEEGSYATLSVKSGGALQGILASQTSVERGI